MLRLLLLLSLELLSNVLPLLRFLLVNPSNSLRPLRHDVFLAIGRLVNRLSLMWVLWFTVLWTLLPSANSLPSSSLSTCDNSTIKLDSINLYPFKESFLSPPPFHLTSPHLTYFFNLFHFRFIVLNWSKICKLTRISSAWNQYSTRFFFGRKFNIIGRSICRWFYSHGNLHLHRFFH